ncbi:hypothetical protein KF707_02705 [Candidatus Obscuribacterales bacterium]|nr:hypothetical protein [Candidatus Obscuribacterales bacterium]
MTTWTNMSSDPSSDERVLRDAQKTIEKVVEAARVALDDELAVQQMEYDQVYGLNSMQFAMYQTLVMTFFQDHQMLASLNLKRSQRDLSPGVNESKRAQLMEVIAQRVSTSAQSTGQPSATGQTQMPANQLPAQPTAWSNGAAQTPPPAWGQPPVNAVTNSNASWLDQTAPQAAAETSAGDWLSTPGTTERPPSSAWPTAGEGAQDASNWTLKPGGGQLPVGQSTSESNGGWNSTPTAWPSDKSKSGEGAWPQPAASTPENNETESAWPTPAAAPIPTSSWPEQPGANKQLPPAAWPASNSGAPPRNIEPSAPQTGPSDVMKPAWTTPIGDSGQSGTWTMDSKPTVPPAPAWSSSATQEQQSNNWNAQPQQPSAPQTPAPTSSWSEQMPSQSTWNNATTSGDLPKPAWQSNSGAAAAVPPAQPANQPWQAPVSSNQQYQSGPNQAALPAAAQPWQQQTPPVAPANSPQVSQQPWQAPSGGPPQPAWQPQTSQAPQPQPWQGGAPQATPAQQFQQPGQPWTPPVAPAPQPPQTAQQQPQQSPQPWTPPGPPTGSMTGMPPVNGIPQPGSNGNYGQQGSNGTQPPAPAWQTGAGLTPPVMPQPAYQSNTPPYPAGQDYQNPAAQQPSSYQHQGQVPQQAYQQQPPNGSTEDMSISFSQQAPQGQNGATLGGVLRQMRSFDPARKRSDDEQNQGESYNPNNAW